MKELSQRVENLYKTTKDRVKSKSKPIRHTLMPVLATGAIALGACGGGDNCQTNPTAPECNDGQTNQKPRVSLIADPTQGVKPLDVNVNVDGSDPDGNVKEYKLSTDQDTSDYEITTQNPIDTTLTFQDTTELKAQTEDDQGETSNATTQKIQPRKPKPTYLRAGQIIDSETGQGKKGKLIVYDAADTIPVDTIESDTAGNIQETKISDKENENIIIQAGIFQEDSLESYISTYTANTDNGGTIGPSKYQAIPFKNEKGSLESFRTTPQEFLEHLQRLKQHGGSDSAKVEKIPVSEVKTTCILSENPEVGDNAQFSEVQQDTLVKPWKNQSDIPIYLSGEQPDTVITGDCSDLYSIDSNNGKIDVEKVGSMIVVPDTTLPAVGSNSGRDPDNDGDDDSGVIRLHPEYITIERLAMVEIHEAGHLSSDWVHSNVYENEKCNMQTPVKARHPTYVDWKASDAMYKFEDGQWIEDIARLNFFN